MAQKCTRPAFQEKPAGHPDRRVDHFDKSQRRPNGRAFLPPDSETALRPARTARVFTITNPRKIRHGALVGAFDLEMPWGIKLSGAMLKMDGKRWVRFPSVVEFVSPEARGRFYADVLTLAEEALR
jgi:hypothetical protein